MRRPAAGRATRVANCPPMSQQLTIWPPLYSVSNASMNAVHSPWKIRRRKARREEQIFERPRSSAGGIVTSLARSFVSSTRVWRAWICRRERGAPFDTLPLSSSPPLSSPRRRPTLHVIIRCRRGQANILITSQYINYWPYNLAGTRRGISPRNVQTRTNVLRPSASSARSAFRYCPSSPAPLVPLLSPLLSGFSLFSSLRFSYCSHFYGFLNLVATMIINFEAL